MSYRKSIRRDKIEGDFEALLGALQPTQNLFEITKALFKEGWNRRLAHTASMAQSVNREMTKIEKQIEGLLDRIVEASSPSVINAYENRIAKLEKNKLLMKEKMENGGPSKRPFDELFELALVYLSSPLKLWASDRLEDKRTVLKLTFAERLAYCRKGGFRTPKTTLPFKALGVFCSSENVMAHLDRESLNRCYEELRDWARQLPE